MYDVIIIGGGPAGYRAALNLSKRNKRVLLIEKNKLGGTCLNEGCIPTKSILNSSHESISFNELVFKRDEDVKKLFRGLTYQIDNSGIDYINGEATIVAKNDNGVVVNTNDKEYCGENLIIATGSKQSVPNIDGLKDALDSGFAITNKELLSRQNDFPDKIAIIGGGVIGIEFATFLSNIGKKVTIFEYMPRLMNGLLDDDVETLLIDSLKKKGVNIVLNAKVQEIDNGIIYELNGEYNEFECDMVVLATGRVANVDGLGLDKIAISFQKCILTDECCKTNILGVYACGDVNGRSMLAHVAYKEAEVAADNICGINSSINYDNIPSVVFSDPEVAISGLSERECQTRGIDYYIKKCSMNYSSMYSIKNPSQKGLCKLIFNKNDELIGAQLIGNGASELIFVLYDMIDRKETVDFIKNKIYPHPSIVEIIKETLVS